MARLHRRGIGMFNLEKCIHAEENLEQSLRGLDLAYEQLWDDAENNLYDREKSYFWRLMFGVSALISTPVVRDVTKAMNRCVLSVVMFWNAGYCSAGEISQRAEEMFTKWFNEEFLPSFDKNCAETDEKLLAEFDGYISEAMQNEGISPVHLRSYSINSFYSQLREIMIRDLLPEAVRRIPALVPTEIRDSRFAFVRRRRLRRGVGSFVEAKAAEGPERGYFVCDIIIDDALMIDQANTVLKSLGNSICAAKQRLIGG